MKIGNLGFSLPRTQLWKRPILLFLSFLLCFLGYALRTKAETSTAGSIIPVVTATIPADGEVTLSKTEAIYISFNADMDPATLVAANIPVKDNHQQAIDISSIHYDGLNRMATVVLADKLLAGAAYQVTVTTGVKDKAGISLTKNYIWSFTMANYFIAEALNVLYTSPAKGDVGVGRQTGLSITFNQDINSDFLVNAIILKDAAQNPVGFNTFEYDQNSRTVRTTPAIGLTANTSYEAMVTTNVRSTGGDSLAQNYTWSFTTGSTPFNSPHGNYNNNSVACRACHQTHTAGGRALMNKAAETAVCYTCHDGTGSTKNIKAGTDQVSMGWGYHPISDTGNPNIAGSSMRCTNCHNPHSTGATVQTGNVLCSNCHSPTRYGNGAPIDDTFVSGFSFAAESETNSNLHKTEEHQVLTCASCHASLPHAYPRQGLVAAQNDMPLLAGLKDIASLSKIQDISTNAFTGNWLEESCTTTCHTASLPPEATQQPTAETMAESQEIIVYRMLSLHSRK